MNAPAVTALLDELRAYAGPATVCGLPPAVIGDFAGRDPDLVTAIQRAHAEHHRLRATHAHLLKGVEPELVATLQAGFVNFYPAWAVNPYVPLAAKGPWVVTTHGAVLHDSGGYGMLGHGHAPQAITDVMAEPWVVANIMTASFSQLRFVEALRAELGHTRPDGCPFSRFLCMNSGSESVTVAMRIADRNAKLLTAPGARHAHKSVKILAFTGGFHGRTDRPAQASASARQTYRTHLKTFEGRDNLHLVPPNDIAALRAAFEHARRHGIFFEILMVEPVMGEGNPGVPLSRAFYDEARRLCTQMGTLLLVDSIQAGLRGHGCLSLVDYPDFTDAEPPDLETWSKALNAAQYPLSVLGMTEHAASLYARGIYGNTMTANPRALEVGTATLRSVTPELRANIRDRGHELVAALRSLADDLGHDVITDVHGTGLLVAADLHPTHYPVNGDGGVEQACRAAGLGVIHGGANALRFTPHFRLTSAEIAMMVDTLRGVLSRYGRR